MLSNDFYFNIFPVSGAYFSSLSFSQVLQPYSTMIPLQLHYFVSRIHHLRQKFHLFIAFQKIKTLFAYILFINTIIHHSITFLL